MSDEPGLLQLSEAPEIQKMHGEHWGGFYKILTPSMRPRDGSLGVNWLRLPPGRTAVPFHSHQREDEFFFILSGRGVLRYGEALYSLQAGSCVSCPAKTGKAHQIANTSQTEDLVYLAVGLHDPDEVCRYPDSGKILVRSLGMMGRMAAAGYMDGEPDSPRIFDLAESQGLAVGAASLQEDEGEHGQAIHPGR